MTVGGFIKSFLLNLAAFTFILLYFLLTIGLLAFGYPMAGGAMLAGGVFILIAIDSLESK